MSVTVWWASPAHAREWHDRLLTPVEHKRAEAYRRRRDRDRFVVGNALLRLTLHQRLGHPPELDRTCPDCGKPHGRPVLAGGGIDVSVSHSGDRIAVALSDAGPVGVDVETIQDDKDVADLLRYVFSPAELETLPDPEAVFYQVWSRKEAVLKASGRGLRTPMSTLTVLPETTHNIRDLDPGPGYAGAVAILAPEPFTVHELDGAGLLATEVAL